MSGVRARSCRLGGRGTPPGFSGPSSPLYLCCRGVRVKGMKGVKGVKAPPPISLAPPLCLQVNPLAPRPLPSAVLEQYQRVLLQEEKCGVCEPSPPSV